MPLKPQWAGEEVLCRGGSTAAGLQGGEDQAGFVTTESQPTGNVRDPDLVFYFIK